MMDEDYIRRCFELAQKSTLEVKSNPQVGAVLVYNDRIIGEGYYQQFGGAHAEVHAINNVKDNDQTYIPLSTLYVSLEPCCIEAKTPACTDLIIRSKVKRVVISCLDPNPKIAGKGVRILKEHGIQVVSGVLEEEGKRIIVPFQCALEKNPFITLKWAKSKDNYIGQKDKRIILTNDYSNVLTHRLRAEHDAILIGTNTAILDNPQLTTRHYPGRNPLRVVLDKTGRIPLSHYLYSDEHPTLIITESKTLSLSPIKKIVQLTFDDPLFINKLCDTLFKEGIYRLLVEGGAKTIKSFIISQCWHQAFIISTNVVLQDGIKAPLIHGKSIKRWIAEGDQIIQIANDPRYS